MDFLYFIRLFKRNIILLIGIPLLLAIAVYYFTRTHEKVYESESIIYTGFTTGYSIESTSQRPSNFFTTSAQFDNMINLLTSRQTVVETSIRLLAQDLSLPGHNPQYISNENYDILRNMIPKRIKDLVVVNNLAGKDREKEEQIKDLQKKINSLQQQINVKKNQEAKYESSISNNNTNFQNNSGQYIKNNYAGSIVHVVLPGESLASIANQYGVSRGELISLNNLSSGNVSPGQRIIIRPGANQLSEKASQQNNYYTQSSDTANASHQKSKSRSKSFSEVFVRDPIVPPGVNPSDFYQTVKNLTEYYEASDTNYVYGLLHYGSSKHYSIKSISNVNIYRIASSDLVKLTYTSDDPGICQQTLKIIATVFMHNYKMLRINETDQVVQYFRHQVDSAERKLNEAEDRLLKFNERNNIINYYEQSKAIALQKEDLDTYFQNQQIKLSEASMTLQQLETKMTGRDSIYLKSDQINQIKKQLSDVTEKIILNRLADKYNTVVAARLKVLEREQAKLRDKIKFLVDQLYLYGHSTQGISIHDLLSEWLKNTISYTEAKAALVVLARRKLDFIRTYQKMAPLGAMLTRIQREITVNEQTYMQLLHSLYQAKLKEQNLQLSTNIKVVDPPYFPITANPSKSKYLVLAAGLAGFVIIAFLIIMFEYFDTSAKNPSRVVEQTEMELGGAYPYLHSKNLANELAFISGRLIDMIIQNIKQNLASRETQLNKPYIILIFSTQNQVGKTLITQKVTNQMQLMGNKVLFLNYRAEDSVEEEEDFNHSFHYTVKNDFIDVADLQQLVDTRYLRKNNAPYDYIFLEIPSIVYHTYPIKLLSEVDLSLCIVKSSDNFTRADKTALKSFREAAPDNFLVILNSVELYNLDELLTKIPKSKRAWVNRMKAIYLNLTKYKITIKREVKNRG